MGLRWLVNAYNYSHSIQAGDGYSHFIHKAKDVGPQKGSVLGIKGVGSQDARGLPSGMQGDGFASNMGGIMEVAMWLCTLLPVEF